MIDASAQSKRPCESVVGTGFIGGLGVVGTVVGFVVGLVGAAVVGFADGPGFAGGLGFATVGAWVVGAGAVGPVVRLGCVDPLGLGEAVAGLGVGDVVFGAVPTCGARVPVRIGAGAAGLDVAAGFTAETPAVPLGGGEPVARPADDVRAAVPELVTEPAAEPLTPLGVSPLEGCPELGTTDDVGDASTPVSMSVVEVSLVGTAFAAFAGPPLLPPALLSTNHTKPTNAITARAITRDRRSQYTLGSRGPTGCITNSTVSASRD